MSLESPTIKQISKKEFSGGAANLVKHLLILKRILIFYFYFGVGLDLLQNMAVNVINFSEGHLNIKSRYWVNKGDNSYKILQVNETKLISSENKVISEFNKKVDISLYEKVIVSDYRLGLANQELVDYVGRYSNFSIGASQLSDKELTISSFQISI